MKQPETYKSQDANKESGVKFEWVIEGTHETAPDKSLYRSFLREVYVQKAKEGQPQTTKHPST